jgi:4-hydroxy-tetrahydrodipicolinate reductase
VGELRDLFGSGAIGAGPNCIWAPNFAIGAVLMMKMAEIAAPCVEGAEIIELHHDKKVDAPSGTSIETARMIAAARAAAGAGALSVDPTKRETIAGTRGGVGEDSIRIHSVRLPGLVAHQEVIFGFLGQSLSIRHDSYDRTSFMPGVLAAVNAVPARPGLTIGLASVLGL